MLVKTNIGTADRIMRYTAATLLLSLAVFGLVEGMFAAVLMGVAALLLLTGLTAVCPAYMIVGASTRKS